MKLPKIKDDVISTEVAGEYHIVNLETGTIYEGTKEIVLFLELFKKYDNMNDIIPLLLPTYDSAEKIEKKVEEATQIFKSFDVFE